MKQTRVFQERVVKNGIQGNLKSKSISGNKFTSKIKL
jgi:hypothetical protein